MTFGSIFGDVISDSLSGLQHALTGAQATSDPQASLAALQAAGNAAVSVAGPAIDALSGSSSKVMTMTQWAWQKNAALAAETDLQAAIADAQQMLTWYTQASKLAQSLHAPAAAPAAVTARAPAPVSAIKPAPATALAPAAGPSWFKTHETELLIGGALALSAIVLAVLIPHITAAKATAALIAA
jgi:hypothetical protein